MNLLMLNAFINRRSPIIGGTIETEAGGRDYLIAIQSGGNHLAKAFAVIRWNMIVLVRLCGLNRSSLHQSVAIAIGVCIGVCISNGVHISLSVEC